MSKAIEAVKAWARENMYDSYGASVFIECYDDDDYEEVFGRYGDDVEAAMDMAKSMASVSDDGYANARALERESGEFE